MSGLSDQFSELPQLFFDLLEQREAAKQARRAPASPTTSAPVTDRFKRAKAYLASIPGAVSGQGGHDQTWAAAQALVRGFDLSEQDALDLLVTDYNHRCDPQWSQRELRHKVADAAERSQLARGYLLNEPPPAREPKQRRLAIATLPPEQAWRADLTHNDAGKVERTLANIMTILSKHPEWMGVLGYDLFAERMVIRKPPPFPRPAHETASWNDTDDLRTLIWLEGNERYRGPLDLVCRAVTAVSRAQAYHPVRDYLRSLRWDGLKRVDAWLTTVFGAVPNEYTQAVGRCFLVGATARVMRPGCKADAMVVLEGPQGYGKSTAVAMLCNDRSWFTDSIGEMGSKQSMEAVAGRWLIEIAELDSMNRSEVSAVKVFATCQADKYRPAYGHRVVEQPRQCVFFGTVNPDANGYLRDETGNRRFWPVAQTSRADLKWLEANRHQLWAEAVVAFDAGEQWHLSQHIEQLASGEQSARVVHDDWEEKIATWLIGKNEVTTSEILSKVFDLEAAKHDRGLQMRVGRCLFLAGWNRVRIERSGVRSYVYRPKTLI